MAADLLTPIKKILRQPSLGRVVFFVLIIIGIALRLRYAMAGAWRDDEIVYVDWIGSWFSNHLIPYLLQWHHTIYPPQSPYFANPPLAMWLFGIVIKIAPLFGLTSLFAVRLFNILVSVATLLVTYRFAKQYFGNTIAMLATVIMSMLPLAIVNNASAFLDTLLGLELLLALWAVFALWQKPRLAVVWYCGILFALLFLTKLSIAPVFIILFAACLYRLIVRKQYMWAVLLVVLTIGLPMLVWSGYRDPHHITGVFHYLHDKYEAIYSANGWRFVLYVVQDVPSSLLIATFFGVILAFFGIRAKLPEATKVACLAGLVGIAIGWLALVAPASFDYQLLPLTPFIAIIGSWGMITVAHLVRNKKIITIVSVIGLLELMSMIAVPTPYLGLSQAPIAQYVGTFGVFAPRGTGSEGVQEMAQFIRGSLPQTAHIAALYDDWTLLKYLGPEQTTTSWFPAKRLEDLTATGADFAFAAGHNTTPDSPAAQSIVSAQPIHIVSYRNMVIGSLFAVPKKTTKIQDIPLDQIWTPLTNNATITNIVSDQRMVGFSVAFRDINNVQTNHFASLIGNQAISIPGGANAVEVSISGGPRSKNVYLDFLDSVGNYKRATVAVDWHGEHTVVIPLKDFQSVTVVNTGAVSAKLPVLKISVDSVNAADTSVLLTDFSFVEVGKP